MNQTASFIRQVADTALWAAVHRAKEDERPDPQFRDQVARRLAEEGSCLFSSLDTELRAMTNERMLDLFRQVVLSDQELDELSVGIADRVNHLPASPSEIFHIKVSIELIRAIRRFDSASSQLVETTNSLTRKGLWLSGAALFIAAASLVVAIIVLVK